MTPMTISLALRRFSFVSRPQLLQTPAPMYAAAVRRLYGALEELSLEAAAEERLLEFDNVVRTCSGACSCDGRRKNPYLFHIGYFDISTNVSFTLQGGFSKDISMRNVAYTVMFKK